MALGCSLALLCKEALVCAPMLVALELWSERPEDVGRGRAQLLAVLRSPALLASALVTTLYLIGRLGFFRIRGGGAAMFRGLGLWERSLLALETLGSAFAALLTPFDAELLRSPIGFSSPTTLQHEPVLAALGGFVILTLALLAKRFRGVRAPALLLVAALLPVANILPTGLESRMSDRFLYLPSLALALGVARLMVWARGKRQRDALVVVGITVGLLLGAAGERAKLFRSSATLWAWEAEHGSGATTVLENAARASERDGHLLRARDLRLSTARRYGELGFAEGFPHALAAARLQARHTGEMHRPSLHAYQGAVLALLQRRGPVVQVPLPDNGGIVLPCGSPEARHYAAGHRNVLNLELSLLLARVGGESAAKLADQALASCPRCPPALKGAAQVRLALAQPRRAGELLAQVPLPDTGVRDTGVRDTETRELLAAADLQGQVMRKLRGAPSTQGPALQAAALFLGQAYDPACQRAVASADETYRELTLMACEMGGRRDLLTKLGVQYDARRRARALALRHDAGARASLIRPIRYSCVR